MNYVLKAFAADQAEPSAEPFAADHDAQALDKVRGVFREQSQVRQVEVWCGERRLATVERVA